jgi:hypothetical protein
MDDRHGLGAALQATPELLAAIRYHLWRFEDVVGMPAEDDVDARRLRHER